jgi:hypothetical protein
MDYSVSNKRDLRTKEREIKSTFSKNKSRRSSLKYFRMAALHSTKHEEELWILVKILCLPGGPLENPWERPFPSEEPLNPIKRKVEKPRIQASLRVLLEQSLNSRFILVPSLHP